MNSEGLQKALDDARRSLTDAADRVADRLAEETDPSLCAEILRAEFQRVLGES